MTFRSDTFSYKDREANQATGAKDNEENPMDHEVEVEEELLDMKVDDFLDRKETKKPEAKPVSVVNLSLFDDEE